MRQTTLVFPAALVVAVAALVITEDQARPGKALQAAQEIQALLLVMVVAVVEPLKQVTQMEPHMVAMALQLASLGLLSH